MCFLILSLMAGAAEMITSVDGYSAVAEVECAAGYHSRSQYLIARNERELNSLINSYTRTCASKWGGHINVLLKCKGTGWVATAAEQGGSKSGEACGFKSLETAEQTAVNECRKIGGSNCLVNWSGCDDGTILGQDGDLDPQWKLKHMENNRGLRGRSCMTVR